MTRLKGLGWYLYRGYHTIVRNYGGWVVCGDFQLYKTLADAKNAIDKKEDGTHKAEPRVMRTLSDEEFISAFSS